MSPNLTLYLSIVCYAAATLLVLASLVARAPKLERWAFAPILAGFVSHTFWIASICIRTGHPPLTNLPETSSFIAWTIVLVSLFLSLRFRVNAASFFVYPLTLVLMIITAVVREPFLPLDPSLKSNLFTAHLLLSTVGVASLFIGLAFTILYHLQERSLKSKQRGALYEWIPSLRVCDVVSYRALAIGFSMYTLGILAGVLWAYRTTQGAGGLRAKEAGALVAWILFAALLQSYVNGSYRSEKHLVISAAAFVSIIVAILGIHHA